MHAVFVPGAVATLAPSLRPGMVRPLTLFEPACFGAVRGGLEIERHVVELSPVPTLVVTGGWNALYEEVGEALATSGARHESVEGQFHRPQDHESANELLATHWGAALA